jgi:DNA-binding transcriptional MerR regulator
MTRRLTIGQLAAATGVPTSTIRFWERKAVLPPAERIGAQRRYPPRAVEWVVMLRKCQEAGLTLAEIRELQRRIAGREDGCRDLLRAKLVEIEAKIADLERAHEMLSHAVRCRYDDITQCPKFRAHLASWLPEPAGVH